MTLSWDIDFLRFLWKMARKSPHWEATVTIKRKVWLDWMSLIGFYWLVRKIIENAAPFHFQGCPQWLNCRHRYFLNSNPTRSKWRKQKKRTMVDTDKKLPKLFVRPIGFRVAFSRLLRRGRLGLVHSWIQSSKWILWDLAVLVSKKTGVIPLLSPFVSYEKRQANKSMPTWPLPDCCSIESEHLGVWIQLTNTYKYFTWLNGRPEFVPFQQYSSTDKHSVQRDGLNSQC